MRIGAPASLKPPWWPPAGGGCVMTTAHNLVLTDNPLREQAIACERECRLLRAPAAKPCEQAFGGESCTQPRSEDEA